MRRYTAVFVGLLAISSMVAADPLYKWVDDQGNVHYSDKPAPGAKKIVLPKASTFNAALLAPPQTSASDSDHRHRAKPGDATPSAATAAGYTAIAISAPADQSTLWNTDSVIVNVATTPAWQSGDVTITLDGQTQTVTGTSATFSGLEKGQHTASASVDGKRSQTVTFFIQKTSIAKPPMH
jgi:hypothetical protein